MIAHSSLGNSPFERSRNLRNMMLSGEISLGGYTKNRIYGTLHCASGKRMKLSNRVFFKNETAAREHGYRPCAHCMPEKYRRWMKNILPKDGEVYFYPDLFTSMESDRLYDTLSKEITWKQEPIFIMGKSILQPRLTAWYHSIPKQLKITAGRINLTFRIIKTASSGL